MRFLLVLLALSLASPARAQLTSIRVELDFEGDQVRVGRIDRIAAPAPSWHGFAQDEPLFFEVLTAKGSVVYAEPLSDPRLIQSEGEDAGATLSPRGRTFVYAPAHPLAREIRVCRRSADGVRTSLARAGL